MISTIILYALAMFLTAWKIREEEDDSRAFAFGVSIFWPVLAVIALIFTLKDFLVDS